MESLVEGHYDRVHALCRRMLGNDPDALDATQDCLVAAVRALPRFDGRSAFGTWLYRIATNTCIDELRRRRRRPVPGLDEFTGGDLWQPSSRGRAAGDGASGAGRFTRRGEGDDPADIAATRVDVDAALASLPLEFRTAVVLRDVCDLSYDEIAEILGVPVGTVRSRIARGRAAVARRWSTDPDPGQGPGARPTGADGNPGGSPAVRTGQTHPTQREELST